MTQTKYIINPRYVLRNENDKVVILMKPDPEIASYINVIHPLYAIILSFVDGTTIDEASNNAAQYLNMRTNEISNILTPLIGNKNMVKGFNSVFPIDMIIEYKEMMKKREYCPDDFYCSTLNLELSRLKYPADIICNLTMRCQTSCFYCYADRENHQHLKMTPEKVCNIIDQAHKLGVISFKLMGGDIFTYDGWDIVIERLALYDYYPCISTKMPLNDEKVRKLKELTKGGVPLQISLDTFIPENATIILGVNGENYLKRMAIFINLLEQYEIEYTIHTVLNSVNDNIKDIQSIEHFIRNKNYIKEWYIDSAKCSIYLPYDYIKYKPRKNNVLQITDYVENLKCSGLKFRIHAPTIVRDHNKLGYELKKKVFDNRIACSGNVSSMYILPDGKVTICEELYWHPRFILGDLNINSIEEIWSSKKAKSLFNLQKNEISNESACKTCDEFEECRSYKHVCWRDVILAYGNEHWDFPDPFCPHAPLINKDISME